jgi:hypothetical protein
MLAKKIAAPHAARNFLKALRGMMATAIRAGYATGGFRTWTEEEIAQFEVAQSGRLPRPARIWAIALYRTKAGRRRPHGAPGHP